MSVGRLPRRRAALAVAFAALAACGRGRRPFALGAPLESLPRAGEGPLLGQLPGPVRFALAIARPLESWRAISASPLAKELEEKGLLRDLPALPWVERWEAARARLAELARLPVPGLDALLEGEALVAWVDDDAGGPGGVIWIERLGPKERLALALARALNAVHPSGRDVEIEQRLGLSLREVRIGPGQRVDYFVLADRLVIGSSRRAIERSVDLAISGIGVSAASQPTLRDLEARALAEGFAAVVVPLASQPIAAAIGPRAPLAALLPGVRSLSLEGHTLAADLDPSLWALGSSATGQLPGAAGAFWFGAPGLDLGRAWTAVRPPPGSAPEAELVLTDLDALARLLGRGAWLGLVRAPGGELSPEFGLRTKATEESSPQASGLEPALRRLLTDATVSNRAGLERELTGGGRLFCPAGLPGPICVELCPRWLAVAIDPRALDAAAGLPDCAAPLVEAGSELMALEIPAGGTGETPRVWARLTVGVAGRGEGSWGLAGRDGGSQWLLP